MSILKFICILISLFSIATLSFAKNDDYYKTVVRILAYSDISPSAQICVFNNPAVTQNFQNFLRRQQSTYTAVAVNATNFKNTSCQAIYFSNLSSKEENRLIRSYPKNKLLSVSDNNPQCELGSIICLSSRVDKPVVIDINLDSLARSQIKINSQVLYMLKK